MIRTLAALSLPALALAACTTTGSSFAARDGQGTFYAADGSLRGTAALVRTGDRLTLAIATQGLPAGQHGIHLHMTGRCDAPDFTTAGGHLNPGQHQHGTMNPAGHHLGDLPNLVVNSAGVGTLTAELGGSASEIESALFDADGSAIVIHAGPDDYKTDPSGNSGGRIACAILKRT
ncbi:superoxide dismutase family protein [Parablastomonas sp. CN1-191]|uniref:superoxide dismutase family protein n=1 Tax=Parablastomonas sp. CN1-191 TaxID=3400908 RepID=UPI003BF81F78